jgi:putative transposase
MKIAVLMGEKRIKGRKRHIVTDIMGNLLMVKVHAANIHDTMSDCYVYQEAKNKYPSLRGVCADAGYRGTFVNFVKTNMRSELIFHNR